MTTYLSAVEIETALTLLSNSTRMWDLPDVFPFPFRQAVCDSLNRQMMLHYNVKSPIYGKVHKAAQVV